jgi:hypothetical protein
MSIAESSVQQKSSTLEYWKHHLAAGRAADVIAMLKSRIHAPAFLCSA